jgi:hypothetical protein
MLAITDDLTFSGNNFIDLYINNGYQWVSDGRINNAYALYGRGTYSGGSLKLCYINGTVTAYIGGQQVVSQALTLPLYTGTIFIRLDSGAIIDSLVVTDGQEVSPYPTPTTTPTPTPTPALFSDTFDSYADGTSLENISSNWAKYNVSPNGAEAYVLNKQLTNTSSSNNAVYYLNNLNQSNRCVSADILNPGNDITLLGITDDTNFNSNTNFINFYVHDRYSWEFDGRINNTYTEYGRGTYSGGSLKVCYINGEVTAYIGGQQVVSQQLSAPLQTGTIFIRLDSMAIIDNLFVTSTNTPPSVTIPTTTPINEGGTYSATGSFTDDPNSNSWTGTVDYGDGTGEKALTINPGRTFSLSHVYQDNKANDDPYIVTVKITDNQGATNNPPATAQVTVHNVAPTPGAISARLYNSLCKWSEPEPITTARGGRDDHSTRTAR